MNYIVLLPTRSEERGVLGVGSIPVATLPSYQDMKTTALQLHIHEYSWVVKISSGHNTPLGHHTDCSATGLGQYNREVLWPSYCLLCVSY